MVADSKNRMDTSGAHDYAPQLNPGDERMAWLKATLTIALKANHVVVAELEDPVLWQRILAAIKLGDTASQKPETSNPAVAAAGRKEMPARSELVR